MHPLVAEAITTITHAKLDDMSAGEFESNAETRRQEVEHFMKKFMSQHPDLAEEFAFEFGVHASRMVLTATKALNS
jgi:hypothetical protein